MASSSSLAHNWTYHVFASFHEEDVRNTFISYLHEQISHNGMTMFDEHGIEGSNNIGHTLIQAIRESRISLVVFSKNYVSSSRCLDELVEILKCKEELGQGVIPIYYHGVASSDVRNQTGYFGKAFKETSAGKTEEVKRRWRQALYLVSEIRGVHFHNRDDAADNMHMVVKDIKNILIARPNLKFAKEIFPEEWGDVFRKVETNHDDRDPLLILEYEAPSSNEQIEKSWYSTGIAFLVVINLLVEIASAITDQLSSITFARISIGMSVLSVVLSLLDLIFKMRVQKACFQCNWPIPWFYYPPCRYNKILGNLTDTALLCCVVAHLVVSGINYSFIHKRQDAPINVIVWPLVFAIAMVITKFMEKPAYSGDILPITKNY